MLNGIVGETIMLDYPHVDIEQLMRQTSGFLRWLTTDRAYYFVDVAAMVSAEGGMDSIRDSLALSALAYDPNWRRGFGEYSNLLQKWYGPLRKENQNISLEKCLDEWDWDATATAHKRPLHDPVTTVGMASYAHDYDMDQSLDSLRLSLSERLRKECNLTDGHGAERVFDAIALMSARDQAVLENVANRQPLVEASLSAGAKVGTAKALLAKLRRLASR